MWLVATMLDRTTQNVSIFTENSFGQCHSRPRSDGWLTYEGISQAILLHILGRGKGGGIKGHTCQKHHDRLCSCGGLRSDSERKGTKRAESLRPPQKRRSATSTLWPLLHPSLLFVQQKGIISWKLYNHKLVTTI